MKPWISGHAYEIEEGGSLVVDQRYVTCAPFALTAAQLFNEEAWIGLHIGLDRPMCSYLLLVRGMSPRTNPKKCRASDSSPSYRMPWLQLGTRATIVDRLLVSA